MQFSIGRRFILNFSMAKHCRKSSHSRTKENLWVIQIQKALRSKLENLKPFYGCNKEFYVSTEQAAFWLEVEVVCCQLTPFFTKHDGLKSQGRRSIGRHLPLPQRLLLSRPMITDEATKIQKLSWKYTMLSLKFDAVTGEMRRVSIECKVRFAVKYRILVLAPKLIKRTSV